MWHTSSDGDPAGAFSPGDPDVEAGLQSRLERTFAEEGSSNDMKQAARDALLALLRGSYACCDNGVNDIGEQSLTFV
jgi:hypothetical protein